MIQCKSVLFLNHNTNHSTVYTKKVTEWLSYSKRVSELKILSNTKVFKMYINVKQAKWFYQSFVITDTIFFSNNLIEIALYKKKKKTIYIFPWVFQAKKYIYFLNQWGQPEKCIWPQYWSSTNSRLSLLSSCIWSKKYIHIYSKILQCPRHRKSLYSNLKYHFLNSFRARKSPPSISQLNCQVRQASRLWNYLVTQFRDFGTESETTA